MKPNPNNKSPETYANRVAQFQESERRLAEASKMVALPKKAAKADAKSKEKTSVNLYAIAREKVLKGYSPIKQREIVEMELSHNVDNRHYERFVCDILEAAQDVPSLGIRNRIKGI